MQSQALFSLMPVLMPCPSGAKSAFLQLFHCQTILTCCTNAGKPLKSILPHFFLSPPDWSQWIRQRQRNSLSGYQGHLKVSPCWTRLKYIAVKCIVMPVITVLILRSLCELQCCSGVLLIKKKKDLFLLRQTICPEDQMMSHANLHISGLECGSFTLF